MASKPAVWFHCAALVRAVSPLLRLQPVVATSPNSLDDREIHVGMSLLHKNIATTDFPPTWQPLTRRSRRTALSNTINRVGNAGHPPSRLVCTPNSASISLHPIASLSFTKGCSRFNCSSNNTDLWAGDDLDLEPNL